MCTNNHYERCSPFTYFSCSNYLTSCQNGSFSLTTALHSNLQSYTGIQAEYDCLVQMHLEQKAKDGFACLTLFLYTTVDSIIAS
jgi:hypothetical protein